MSITSFNVLNVTSLCTTNNPTFLSHKTKKSIKSLHLGKLEPGNDLQLIVCQSTNCFSAVALFYFGILLIFCVCVQIECPEFPEDLKHWISFISASSQALRAESGLEEKNKWSHTHDTMYHECRPTYHLHCTHLYSIHTYILPHKLLNTVESF